MSKKYQNVLGGNRVSLADNLLKVCIHKFGNYQERSRGGVLRVETPPFWKQKQCYLWLTI